MSEIIPWEELILAYSKSMSDFGRPALSPRIAIGAMVIKTILSLSDEETVAQIQENMYMQYFLGLEKYQEEPLLDPSLLVHIRERMGKEMLDEMNGIVVVKAVKESVKKEKAKKETQGKSSKTQGNALEGESGSSEKKTEDSNTGKDIREESTDKENANIEKAETHKGTYILDATIADEYIKYPTDVELLSDSRQKSEEIIDMLYTNSQIEKKPRTYRKVARKAYLTFAKKRKKTANQLRKARKQQLNYLRRNLNTIETILNSDSKLLKDLDKQKYRTYLVIQEIYRQQNQMHQERENRCDNRIVSISQPQVRPMVRGKQGKTVEFGSKILAGITDEGYSLIAKMEWDAYNEGKHVVAAVEDYKKKFGYYPEVVIGDQIFITRENRKVLDRMDIRLSGKSLGRKSEEKKEEEMKQTKEDQKQRVRIEGKFGQGKNGYELNKIRMRKSSTSESMIYMIFFVMNLVRYAKEVLFWPFLQLAKLLKIFLKELLPTPLFWGTSESAC